MNSVAARLAHRSNRIKLVALATALTFVFFALQYEFLSELSWTSALPVLVVVPLVWARFIIGPAPENPRRRIVGLVALSLLASFMTLLVWNTSNVDADSLPTERATSEGDPQTSARLDGARRGPLRGFWPCRRCIMCG